MSDPTVDLDALTGFAGGLDRIRASLAATGKVLDDIGSGKVSGALGAFADHWDDGRKKITDNAKALSSMVHQSVATYRKADNDLSTAIHQSTESRAGAR